MVSFSTHLVWGTLQVLLQLPDLFVFTIERISMTCSAGIVSTLQMSCHWHTDAILSKKHVKAKGMYVYVMVIQNRVCIPITALLLLHTLFTFSVCLTEIFS